MMTLTTINMLNLLSLLRTFVEDALSCEWIRQIVDALCFLHAEGLSCGGALNLEAIRLDEQDVDHMTNFCFR